MNVHLMSQSSCPTSCTTSKLMTKYPNILATSNFSLSLSLKNYQEKRKRKSLFAKGWKKKCLPTLRDTCHKFIGGT